MVALTLPYLPFSAVFGFVPLPWPLMLGMVVLTLAYVGVVELVKKRFYATTHQLGGHVL
jgi:Mg2+-importing ATPase